MDINKRIEILETLASGFSPETGEMIGHDSVLNEREVIRALQIAIDNLKKESDDTDSNVNIEKQDIDHVIQLFNKEGELVTANKFLGFFLGIRKFKNDVIIRDQYYGKYHNCYKKGELFDFFTQYLNENPLVKKESKNINTYREIDFFRKLNFCNLSDKAIEQLRQKVKALELQKTENLSTLVKIAREKHPRAYEPWSEDEKRLLRKAMKYTNNLKLLSSCFQRGVGSIESCGQRLLYGAQIKGPKLDQS